MFAKRKPPGPMQAPMSRSQGTTRQLGGGLAQQDAEAARDDDLLELQRRRRKLEEGRKNYTESSQASLRKLAAMVKRLCKEHSGLQEKLQEYTHPDSQKNNMQVAHHLGEMLELHCIEQEELRRLRANLQTLKHRSLGLESEQRNVERDLGPEGSVMKKRKELERRIGVLEDRVDFCTKSYNEQVKANNELRKKIQGMMVEREHHDAFCKKMEDRVARKRRELSRLVDKLSRTYEQREDADVRLRMLKQSELEDSQMSAAEIQHLRRFLTRQQRLEKFLGQKAAARQGLSIEGEVVPSSDKVQTLSPTSSGLKLVGEDTKEASDVALEMCEKVFERLLKFVRAEEDVSTMDEILQVFARKEKENTALYAYINELQSQSAETHEKIKLLQQELIDVQAAWGGKFPSQLLAERHLMHSQLNEELEEETGGGESSSSMEGSKVQLKISDESEHEDELFEKHRVIDGVFGDVCQRLKALRDLLEIKTTTVGELMADESDKESKRRQDPSEGVRESKAIRAFLRELKSTLITEKNIEQHMSMIEQRAVAVLTKLSQRRGSSISKRDLGFSISKKKKYSATEVKDEEFLSDARSESPASRSSSSSDVRGGSSSSKSSEFRGRIRGRSAHRGRSGSPKRDNTRRSRSAIGNT